MIAKRNSATPVVLALFLCTLLAALPLVAQQMEETTAQAPPATGQGLRVTTFVLGQNYDPMAKAVLDTGSVFDHDVGKVYCFTRVVGCPDSTEIVHAWYHEGQNMAKVNLPVKSASWRTYSSKNIMPSWTGHWEVKVLDGNGAVLASRAFEIR
jgi:hypothetical protein